MTVTYSARTDSNSANNAALNLTGDNAVEITFQPAAGGGDILLEQNLDGSPDSDTVVAIDGVTYEFSVEFTGTLPTTKSTGAGQVPDPYEGANLMVITVYDYPTAGDTTRFAFMPEETATLADMDAFGNGAIAVQGVNETPAPVTICLLRGTLIRTPTGDRPIETLREGDLVVTATGEVRPIRYITYQSFAHPGAEDGHGILPRCIRKDFFGPDLPYRDLYLSRNHRVTLSGPMVELYFEAEEVFAVAKFLSDTTGGVAEGERIEWFNILLDDHAVIVANGQPVESLFLGDMTLETLSPEDRLAIRARFSDLSTAHLSKSATRLPSLRAHEVAVYCNLAGVMSHSLGMALAA